MGTQVNSLKLFISYAPADQGDLDELENHLALLRKQGLIDAWHARKIRLGDSRKDLIDVQLEAARIILLLISADFMASDYCYDVEMTRAMSRHARGDVTVVPILLRSCDWESAPFASLPMLPENARPVSRWDDRDEAFAKIANALRRLAKQISSPDSDSLNPSTSDSETLRQTSQRMIADTGTPLTGNEEEADRWTSEAIHQRISEFLLRGATHERDSGALQALRILIVDDEPMFLQVLQMSLARKGPLLVEAVASGEEAIRQLGNAVYDCIVTDLVMPGISGFELVRWIQSQGLLTPIIVFSVMGDRDEWARRHIGEAHVDLWISKISTWGTDELYRSVLALSRNRLRSAMAQMLPDWRLAFSYLCECSLETQEFLRSFAAPDILQTALRHKIKELVHAYAATAKKRQGGRPRRVRAPDLCAESKALDGPSRARHREGNRKLSRSG